MLRNLSRQTKDKENIHKNKSKTIRKMATGTYILIITLNVNRLKPPTKRHRLTDSIQKDDLYLCYLQETNFRPRDTYRLKVRAWKKKILHANGNQKKAGIAIIISYKIDNILMNFLVGG